MNFHRIISGTGPTELMTPCYLDFSKVRLHVELASNKHVREI